MLVSTILQTKEHQIKVKVKRIFFCSTFDFLMPLSNEMFNIWILKHLFLPT